MLLYTIALIIHAIICVVLVLVILAQTSKGGLDANLGGAAMNVFGGSGASALLKKWTQILAVLFAASCIMVAFLVKNSRGGVNLTDVQQRQSQIDDTPAPAEPAAAPIQIPAEPAQGE
ncbi:MAG: preprotein translocase subunit SecG [Candidatus Cloacimonadaceae bacterium]|jgi:preprotein translocase subunit SecG|nr:preprotein translocase subunit SecG [Candidatus Cloacimonadota bacterium]MDY0127718.1 preprotein translocase subunit SecG [Candidatus Cloacimonadaceae bacterium]MCB5254042.1 preprotein translocase subunit SecG [Candidatus Cloacimonadota bacterium]MCK9178877.1 preprotein translocase subunit SecG [Candidatus Cloacimonadota bacterium]MCK9242240.1 preprotein translocase subunit SecG [Candidatus Cloacimonadota bacterium]